MGFRGLGFRVCLTVAQPRLAQLNRLGLFGCCWRKQGLAGLHWACSSHLCLLMGVHVLLVCLVFDWLLCVAGVVNDCLPSRKAGFGISHGLTSGCDPEDEDEQGSVLWSFWSWLVNREEPYGRKEPLKGLRFIYNIGIHSIVVWGPYL